MRGPIAVLLLLAAPAAAGEPPTILLDAPAGCPDRAAFLELVAQHAGGAPADVEAEVHVERAGQRWIATVDLPGAPGRRFEGDGCAEVMDAAALVIAFAIDVHQPEAEPAPEAPRDVPPAPAAAPEVARVSRPAPVGSPMTALRVRAGALGDAGTLPGAAIGAAASAAVWRGGAGLELSFALFRPSDASLPDHPAPVAPIALWAVGLRACRGIGFAAACVGGEAGRMSADADALEGGVKAASLWSAASGSGWVRGRLGARAAAFAGVELLAAIVRPRFVLEDDTGLHRPSPVAGRALVGLELDVW